MYEQKQPQLLTYLPVKAARAEYIQSLVTWENLNLVSKNEWKLHHSKRGHNTPFD